MTFAAKVEWQKFVEFAGFKAGDRVWDYGSGTGRYVKPLQLIGCIVNATDIDYGVAPTDKVDKVFLACVLHYNKNKSDILFRAYRSLKRGGSIVIIEPNPFNPFFYCLYFWRWLTGNKCQRRWNKERYMTSRADLVNDLEYVGFRDIKTMKYAWLPSKFGWLKFNEVINKIPVISASNAFNWIVAQR